MHEISDPVMQWAFMILVSVLMGTGLLIVVAFFRRWEQIRYCRYIHALQCEYRPVLAKLLSGAWSLCDIEALRELPLADLELLLEPLFDKRKLTERCLVFFQALSVELGLVELWQRRLANGGVAASSPPAHAAHKDARGRPGTHYIERIKSMRNLGVLRHRPSWPLLVKALDDREFEVQFVALRALAAMGAPDSFPVLRERLHAVAQGKSPSPPLRGLQTAMGNFDLACVPALLPSLRHEDRHIRLHATEILRTIIFREASCQPCLVLTRELLTPPMVEMLLTQLAVDTCSETRARAAEVIVFLDDPRAKLALRDLLLDREWFVRLRAAQALAYSRQAAVPLHLDLRECLRDSHWRVREAAIRTLLSLGREGNHQLYEHFLTSSDHTTQEQIVEVIERTGLMFDLVEDYSKGTKGVNALMVETMASAAPQGLSATLRTLKPETRHRFQDRFLPYTEARRRFHKEAHPDGESALTTQQILDFPPQLAA